MRLSTTRGNAMLWMCGLASPFLLVAMIGSLTTIERTATPYAVKAATVQSDLAKPAEPADSPGGYTMLFCLADNDCRQPLDGPRFYASRRHCLLVAGIATESYRRGLKDHPNDPPNLYVRCAERFPDLR